MLQIDVQRKRGQGTSTLGVYHFTKNLISGGQSDYLLCIQSMREDKHRIMSLNWYNQFGIYALFTKNNANDWKLRGTLRKYMMTKYEN